MSKSASSVQRELVQRERVQPKHIQKVRVRNALKIGQGDLSIHTHMKRMAPPSAQSEEIPAEGAILCHIMLLNSVLERSVNRFAESCGLTFPQWMALGFIGHCGEEGIRHAELGNRLMLSKAPVTGVVDRLERDGYVQRVGDAKDRRVSRVVMTPKGEAVWWEVKKQLRENSQKLFSVFPAQEHEQMLSMLSRLLTAAADADPILNTNTMNTNKERNT